MAGGLLLFVASFVCLFFKVLSLLLNGGIIHMCITSAKIFFNFFLISTGTPCIHMTPLPSIDMISTATTRNISSIDHVLVPVHRGGKVQTRCCRPSCRRWRFQKKKSEIFYIQYRMWRHEISYFNMQFYIQKYFVLNFTNYFLILFCMQF